MSRISRPSNPRSQTRREEIRRSLPKPVTGLGAVLQKPEFINAGLLLCVFLALVSGLVIWSRSQVKVRDGQVMTDTLLYREEFVVEDTVATKAKQEEAIKSSPRIYEVNQSYLDRLDAS